MFMKVIHIIHKKYRVHVQYEKLQFIQRKKSLCYYLPLIPSIPVPNTHTHHPALTRMLAIPDLWKTTTDTLHLPTHPLTHTNGYETGSSWHVQINQKAWRKRCFFSLALKLQEGEALRLAGSEFQTEQCNQKNTDQRFSSLSLEFWAVVLSKNEGSTMVDVQREEDRYGRRVSSKWRKASVESLHWM